MDWNKLKKLSAIELEKFAVHLYGKKKKRHYTSDSDILHMALLYRCSKLNNSFSWTKANKRKFLDINKRLMNVFEISYNEAIISAKTLEQRIQNNDPFVSDYEIEVVLAPYISDKNNFEYDSIALVLSEPDHFPINYSISHSSFINNIKVLPVYLDKSLNWNQLYFGGLFNDQYICHQIHLLMEHNWAFQDILNINQIWSDVKVIHQHHHSIISKEA